jgi:hypothetical protein
MSKVRVAAFVIAMGLALPAAAQLEGPQAATAPGGMLVAAKDLYASARYDEALSVLNGLRAGEAADRKAVEQYRSLCLLALGRASEAESAIAAVVTADPTYRPGASEASPRVRATFTDVRKRLLPDITTSRYQAAKAAYDRRQWADAEAQFRMVLALIDDPDNGGRLTDLRVLTAGFLELSARAAAPPPPPAEPKPAPIAAAAPVAPTRPEAGKIYGTDDDEVTPPVVVRQDIPGIPHSMMAMARSRGLVEVVIDEQGRVVAMTMRTSIHPSYDLQVLTAARDWKYRPATVNGQPVRYRRLISINIQR